MYMKWALKADYLFVHNFFSNREFKVRLGSTLSEAHNQEQDSLKTNIIKWLDPDADCSLCVDDVLLSIQKYEYYQTPASIKS